MIFVVSGTQKFPFDRMFKAIDNLAGQGKISGEIFAQIGSSNYIPKNFKYERFLDAEVFDNYISISELIISHSGDSVILTSLKKEKRLLVIPRLAKFGEHVDNHQIEIAAVFGKQNLLEVCHDIENLETSIENAKSKTFAKYETDLPNASEMIEKFLQGEC